MGCVKGLTLGLMCNFCWKPLSLPNYLETPRLHGSENSFLIRLTGNVCFTRVKFCIITLVLKVLLPALEQYRIQHACSCVFGRQLHLVCSCLQDREPVLQDMERLVYYVV